MNNKDLPMMVAVAKAVSGSSGGGSSLPTPVLPSNPNTRSTLNGIVSTNDNKSFRALLMYYQILINGKSDGTYSVASVGSRTSSASDLLSLFKASSTTLEPISGDITMVLYNYKPDGSHPVESSTVRLKMSGYKSLSDSIVIYFPYTSYRESTLYKGVFVITVTADNFTCDYISET